MEAITTFAQAIPILQALGLEPRPIGGKLWSIGSMTYDKGGVIALARDKQQTMQLPTLSSALPERLQDIARSYLKARRQSGVSLLEAARWLSEARQAAEHGEWAIFLEAIGLDASRARAQIRIHEEAQKSPMFADRIINGFLSETVARELLPLPAEAREEILSRETPPSRAEIRDAKRAPAPVLKPTAPEAITIQTDKGPHQVTPLRSTGILALHDAVGANTSGFAITHLTSGKRIASHTIRFHADRAFDQLAELDWSLVALDGGMSAAMALQVARILVQFDDVDKFDQRRAALARLESRLALEKQGWAFVPAESPKGWIRLEHPDLDYGRNEPTIEAAIKAAGELQAGYDRRDHLRAAESSATAEAVGPLPMDDAAMQAQIRAQAQALGMELVWEDDDRVTLFWPGEDLDQLMPLSYPLALDFLASQPAPEPPRSEAADRQLSKGQYANALSLLASIRACLNADQRANARENTKRLLALLEATN